MQNLINAIANINIRAPEVHIQAPQSRKVSTFSSAVGTDWLVWKRNFVTTATINQWGDLRRRREIAASMEGLAARAVEDIPFEGDEWDVDATYEDLLTRYEERFMPPAESELSLVSFETAAQNDEESTLQWSARCRELYRRAYPNGNPGDRQLINRFILGLKDPQVREYTWDQRPANYTDAVTAANNKTASKAVLAATSSKRGVHSINALKVSDGKCFFCEQPGHMQVECPGWLWAKQEAMKAGKRVATTTKKVDRSKFNRNKVNKARAKSVNCIEGEEGEELDEGHEQVEEDAGEDQESGNEEDRA